MSDKPTTLIIGAGPAGLSAAMELVRQERRDVSIVEKDTAVGGLAKTYTIREGDLVFRTDNGPHRFFSKNRYLYDFIEDILGEQWIKVERHTQQFINGHYLDYPINPTQILKTFGIARVAVFFWDYLKAFSSYRILRKPLATFYDYAIANFGKSLADLNIINYTEKIWGVPARELHADWAHQRISGLSVSAVVATIAKKYLFGGTDGPKSLVDEFYYPEFGSGFTYEKIRERLEKEYTCTVATSTFPTEIRHGGKRILDATLSTPEGLRTVPVDNLVESVHITDFVQLLRPLPPAHVLEAARKLRYRSQVYLFITLNRDRITKNQWIYFPDQSVPFARVTEMKNFSHHMSPPGKTSLFIEFFCNEDDPIRAMNAKQLLDLSIPFFEKYGLFSASDVRYCYRFQGGKDYPIYDLHYREHLKVLNDYLESFENLWHIGRPGRFKYTNQDHSLEMGILAARGILDGTHYDLDSVGAEREYFEKGYARQA